MQSENGSGGCRPVSAGVFLLAVALFAAGGESGEAVRDLRKLTAPYGFDAPLESSGSLLLRSRAGNMSFDVNSRRFLYNGTILWLHNPPAAAGKGWTLSGVDADKVVLPLLDADGALKSKGYTTVLLDPGHGGRDNGATSPRRVLEKKAALDVAKRLSGKLQATGIRVRMTRATDTYVSLSERCEKSAKWNADVCVSIHFNYASDRSVSGIESFVLACAGCAGTTTKRPDSTVYRGNRHDGANTALGYYVHRGMLACTKLADRGVRRARFQVLRDMSCPTVLVECGFLSNKADEAKTIDPRYRDSLAEGIARGLSVYLGKVRHANGRSGR